MSKIHLLIAYEPPPKGSTLTAICGEEIPQAEACALADLNDLESRSTLLFCTKCFGKRYFYAIAGGQQKKDMEDGIEGGQ